MTDTEKIEKLLDYIERTAERFDDDEVCNLIGGAWCEEHCGDKCCPDKECYRHYLFEMED